MRLAIIHHPYRYRDYAHLSAQAAEAARAQGKFWEMHDLMLERRRLDRDSLIGYARELGLDVPRFTRELDEQKYLARVNQDVELAQSLDIYQTPTFFINGRKIVGERPFEDFRKIIDEELAQAQATEN
ncbi:thioredoxin domain-containing protein [Geoalkalibacter halelectricus]|uniref:Thioredoxin domain-containing protein n=1 Tax=Geoalkalibacter halelectricus TaxID=2847045 RepID=A0ABY5ZIB3_9BACT|nr:thioredoxin domain-containing protein [Geoalkalibacter halelectricus]UWZ78883.1 thioredoxin domain-containing protein [Geoalkalibacter halelectricus]